LRRQAHQNRGSPTEANRDGSAVTGRPAPSALTSGLGASDGLSRAAGFNEAVFEEAFEANYRRVCWYALTMLRNATEADEVAAETFDRAYRAWRSGNGPQGPMLPWLLVICRRIVLGQRRRARLIAWVPLLDHDREPADAGGSFEAVEFRVWLRQLESVVSSREREALSLRYLHDLGDAGAALVLGISPSGFRTLISRAVAKLRTHPELWK
jgi:RNA polymerase sigma factor (sigma-70 family)